MPEDLSAAPTTDEHLLPAEYPARWDADVVLADGSTARVRPIRPDDGQRVRDFHSRQSPESIYFRYFTPHPTLSDREVEQLTHIDYVDRMAFVALRDDVMVGVARYDRWPTRSEAEVAFFVDDAHRGLGLATLLLEYLAAAAGEAGISAFTATVLPSNRRMVSVFHQAGYETTSSFEEGVIEVRLDLRPTPEALVAIDDRARRAEERAVRLLLAPRSVAVVGASRQRGSVGHEVLRNLLHHEFAGPIYPVNRAVDHVAGVRAVPSLAAIDDRVDLAVICVPAAEVPAVIEDCGRCQVPAVIVLSAGFAESGPEGEALSAAVLRLARRFGIRLLGPNCLGVINTDPEVRLHATFATPQPRRGRVALLAESGTIGGVILDHMGAVGLGVSSFAAIGNRADVSANDMLQWWATDPRTDIVLLNIESFGNPRRFSRIARQLARQKPVVAVKSGRSARAYPDDDGGDLPVATVGALLRQTGVVRVDTLAELLDVARVLAATPLPAGGRVAVVGNTGGSLVTAADACIDAGLELADPDPAIHEVLGVGATKLRHNPLDLGYQATAGDVERVLRGLLDDDAVDSVLAVCAPSPGLRTTDLVRAIQSARATAPAKPLVASLFGPHTPVISPPPILPSLAPPPGPAPTGSVPPAGAGGMAPAGSAPTGAPAGPAARRPTVHDPAPTGEGRYGLPDTVGEASALVPSGWPLGGAAPVDAGGAPGGAASTPAGQDAESTHDRAVVPAGWPLGGAAPAVSGGGPGASAGVAVGGALVDGGQDLGPGAPTVPVFDFPDAAAHALGQVTRYARWRAEPEGRFVEPEGVVVADVLEAAAAALAEHGEGWLPPREVDGLLQSVGLEPIPARVVDDADAAVAAAHELGYPVAVKLLARDRLAKSEAAGLALDVYGDDHLRATCARMVEARGGGAFPVMVQRMAVPGVDVAVALADHPLVGPVLTLNAGGVATPVSAPQV
ncbi:MAG TPA: GNAT family N-acetyltransferase, partial [Acidimicrobiales bacterium]|nr:GNAT family N-acetyltransferase [Acidimicrobiales bacterium]